MGSCRACGIGDGGDKHGAPSHSVRDVERSSKASGTAEYEIHHLMNNRKDLLDGQPLPMSLETVA